MGALLQFVVLRREGKWVVKAHDQERFFAVQREAVDAAIRLANDSGKEGNPGVVLLQNSKTDFEKIWTYGEDPYPPARSVAGDLGYTGARENRGWPRLESHAAPLNTLG
jgi:hypothetical protein